MRSQTDLHRAFETTDYCIDYENETITLKLGLAPPSPLADWLTHYAGNTPAWLITACNPGGEAVSEAENDARQALLAHLLDRYGHERLAAINRDTDGDWPDEPGWLVAGLEEGLARSIAGRFGQAAMVAVGREKVTLVWTRS